MKTDQYFMQQAINCANKALGNVGDNPAVGCVIVAKGQIIGRGFTKKDGRHAETMALKMAQRIAPELLQNANVYVTLEPCAHFGRTPPCASALVKTKVGKIFVALIDPDPRVSGKGLAILKEAGIKVEVGLLAEVAKTALFGFFSRITTNKPYVMLKLAMSQDGYVVRKDGTSKWITSAPSRRFAHSLRAQHDAILVGINTVITDDPMLNCRLEGCESRSPIRVVLDSCLKTPIGSKLVKSADKIPLMIFTSTQLDSSHEEKIAQLKAENVQIHFINKSVEHLDLNPILHKLSNLGINRLMVEGGSKVASAFVEANLIDELNLFFAPEIIGEGGVLAITNGIESLLKTHRFNKITQKSISIDRFELWRRNN